jgi:hypothetical protein
MDGRQMGSTHVICASPLASLDNCPLSLAVESLLSFSESIHGVSSISGKSIPWFLSICRFLQVGVRHVLLELLTFWILVISPSLILGLLLSVAVFNSSLLFGMSSPSQFSYWSNLAGIVSCVGLEFY